MGRSITTRLIALLTLCAAVIIGAGMLIDYRLSETQMTSRQHRLSNGLDYLLVKRMIWQRDPELVARQGTDLKHQYAEEALAIAYEHADPHPRIAWRLLLDATFGYGVINSDTFRALLRLLVPGAIRRFVQRRRCANSVIKPT